MPRNPKIVVEPEEEVEEEDGSEVPQPTTYWHVEAMKAVFDAIEPTDELHSAVKVYRDATLIGDQEEDGIRDATIAALGRVAHVLNGRAIQPNAPDWVKRAQTICHSHGLGLNPPPQPAPAIVPTATSAAAKQSKGAKGRIPATPAPKPTDEKKRSVEPGDANPNPAKKPKQGAMGAMGPNKGAMGPPPPPPPKSSVLARINPKFQPKGNQLVTERRVPEISRMSVAMPEPPAAASSVLIAPSITSAIAKTAPDTLNLHYRFQFESDSNVNCRQVGEGYSYESLPEVYLPQGAAFSPTVQGLLPDVARKKTGISIEQMRATTAYEVRILAEVAYKDPINGGPVTGPLGLKYGCITKSKKTDKYTLNNPTMQIEVGAEFFVSPSATRQLGCVMVKLVHVVPGKPETARALRLVYVENHQRIETYAIPATLIMSRIRGTWGWKGSVLTPKFIPIAEGQNFQGETYIKVTIHPENVKVEPFATTRARYEFLSAVASNAKGGDDEEEEEEEEEPPKAKGKRRTRVLASVPIEGQGSEGGLSHRMQADDPEQVPATVAPSSGAASSSSAAATGGGRNRVVTDPQPWIDNIPEEWSHTFKEATDAIVDPDDPSKNIQEATDARVFNKHTFILSPANPKKAHALSISFGPFEMKSAGAFKNTGGDIDDWRDTQEDKRGIITRYLAPVVYPPFDPVAMQAEVVQNGLLQGGKVVSCNMSAADKLHLMQEMRYRMLHVYTQREAHAIDFMWECLTGVADGFGRRIQMEEAIKDMDREAAVQRRRFEERISDLEGFIRGLLPEHNRLREVEAASLGHNPSRPLTLEQAGLRTIPLAPPAPQPQLALAPPAPQSQFGRGGGIEASLAFAAPLATAHEDRPWSAGVLLDGSPFNGTLSFDALHAFSPAPVYGEATSQGTYRGPLTPAPSRHTSPSRKLRSDQPLPQPSMPEPLTQPENPLTPMEDEPEDQATLFESAVRKEGTSSVHGKKGGPVRAKSKSASPSRDVHPPAPMEMEAPPALQAPSPRSTTNTPRNPFTADPFGRRSAAPTPR
jgi:hypothetical protein